MVITSFRLHLYINLHLLNFPHQNGTPSYPAGKFQTRLDRMNTPNTRPITSSLALNCLTSPCKRELVALRHDALIWKTSKRLLKITTQDQAWRNWRATAHAADPKEKRLCECVATDRQLKGLLPIFRYPSQIRFECFVLMSCFDAACHLAQHLPVHSSLARVSFLGWGSQTRCKVCAKGRGLWKLHLLGIQFSRWSRYHCECQAACLNFLWVLVQFNWLVPHISNWSLEASTHFTRRILFQWSRGNEHWGFVKKNIWKHCQQKLWMSIFY